MRPSPLHRSRLRRSRRWRLLLLAFVATVAALLLAVNPRWALEAYFAALRWQAGAHEARVAVGSDVIVQLEAGPADAPLVVLLHGFTGGKENFLPLMAELAPTYRMIAPDLPGWGESTRRADADYGVVAQSERISAWLKALPRKPDLLVGHSMGGHIAALVAANHPEQVKRLALMSSAGVPFKENAFAKAVLQGGHPFAVDNRSSLDAYLGLVFTDPPFVPWPVDRAFIEHRIADHDFEVAVLNRMRGEEAFAVQPLLGRIRAPVLLLWCDDDRVIDPSAAAVYAEGLATSRTVMLSGCGHMPMVAEVDAVAQALRTQAALPAP